MLMTPVLGILPGRQAQSHTVSPASRNGEQWHVIGTMPIEK